MFSNQTPNYGLPQYEQNDTLNVLSDFNGAMETIDSTMKTNELAAASAQSKADGADAKANNNATAIGDLQTAQGEDRTDINTLTGAVNTISSLIGNGEPTTDDKTIIGAINELKEDVDELAQSSSAGAWTSLGTITVATPVDVPTAAKEIFVEYTPNSGTIALSTAFIALIDSGTFIITSISASTPQPNGAVVVDTTNHTITCNAASATNPAFKVYYR